MVFIKPKECIKVGRCKLEVCDPQTNIPFVDGKIHPVCALCSFYIGSINDKHIIELRNEVSKMKLLFGK